MILTTEQIKDIILNNPGAGIVKKGTEYTKKLRMHMYGDQLDSNLEAIDGFEKKALRDLRVKYTKSNKDLFSRLSRPLDKVFSARGGSIYYNLGETADKRARALASDVRNGYDIRKWVETYWKPHMLDDPFGLVFLEILPTKQALLAKQQGRSFVYPTYKSITAIYDYLPKGSALEYVVFNVSAAEKKAAGIDKDLQVYRVVDDASDYYVARENESIRVIDEIPNYFGQVPAMVNSDIADSENECCFLSLFDNAIELAGHFLLKGSIKVTHEFMHGFPKYWEYADDCAECQGTGYVEGEKCPTCKGAGKSIMSKVSDAKLLTYPLDKEAPQVAPNVAGYVSPDKTYHEIATADLSMLEDLMNITLWGAPSKVQTQGMSTSPTGETKTATEVMDEIKPQSDRLHPVSEMAEKRHKFILDAVVRLQVAPTYEGSSVNYGRRYMIEGPDAIWEKYSDARAKGVAISVLDDLLLEYYEAKYSTDPVKLAIQGKLMRVEPFVHYKASEVKGLSPDPVDYAAKLYFGEWLSTMTEGAILSQDVAALRASLATYCTSKILPSQEEKQPIAA